ncbi:class I histocompatibility antigen, F10 alpha chain-like isoform X2 [Scleropages formosus]|uniref:class I histocompatibility antigen, F10 alpha chain-like isoform X2 n=1 Tax=Scleropages formosus TaxID=113540 RepID=UPI0010FA7DCC|nr:class I histocompatibility antigen, F10 alpha chain-like isoform X2 [Scleropages formosus]
MFLRCLEKVSRRSQLAAHFPGSGGSEDKTSSRDTVSSIIIMKVPAVVLLILGSVHLASTDTHSLTMVATFISGETQFPEITMVLLVNDVPVEYYDSDIKKIVSRRHWRANDSIQETDLRDYVVAVLYSGMKTSLNTMMKRSNQTQGAHVYQSFTACDLENDTLSRFFIMSAYDEEEKYQYDALSHIQNTFVPEFVWSKVKSDIRKHIFSSIYQPLCVRTLRRYLQEDKNILLRKERPRVRVIQKTEPHSGRTQVSCVATGFYPRRVNMTLLRDDRPVPDRELTGGQVLPNGDGTYQLRRSLSVSEEELRERHRYTCTVSHLSVDNKLDVNWEPEAPADPVLISAVLIAVLVLAALIITAIVLCRKRRHTEIKNLCPSAVGVKYAAAQSEYHTCVNVH